MEADEVSDTVCRPVRVTSSSTRAITMMARVLLLVFIGSIQLAHSTAFSVLAGIAPRQLIPRAVGRRRPTGAVYMAAKGKKNEAISFKGFGALPDKLEDSTPESSDEMCACQSGQSYALCCKPFHAREKWPETPLQLMRSRFAHSSLRFLTQTQTHARMHSISLSLSLSLCLSHTHLSLFPSLFFSLIKDTRIAHSLSLTHPRT